MATSWPVAMNIAVMPLAEWAPLLLTPDMKPPRLETCARAVHQLACSSCMTLLEQRVRDRRLGDHALAARVQHVDLRALLVGGEVATRGRSCSMRGSCSRIHGRPPAVALPVMFWPGGVAGRVVEARVEDAAGRVLLDVAAACPTSWSPRRPRAISSKCSSSHSPNARASRALSNRNAGARCMRSSMTVVLTPPASWSSFIPRLYEATSVPSAVASGT